MRIVHRPLLHLRNFAELGVAVLVRPVHYGRLRLFTLLIYQRLGYAELDSGLLSISNSTRRRLPPLDRHFILVSVRRVHDSIRRRLLDDAAIGNGPQEILSPDHRTRDNDWSIVRSCPDRFGQRLDVPGFRRFGINATMRRGTDWKAFEGNVRQISRLPRPRSVGVDTGLFVNWLLRANLGRSSNF